MQDRLPRIAAPAALVAALTIVAFVVRALNFDQGLFADELSTAWIVSGHSLGHVLHEVRSNDEITPPLYFVLAWASSKLGSNPDLLRLPSLVGGVATVPLVYALGARTVGRRAGIVGAAIVALSPFLIYYSVEARSYSLMIALVAGASLALVDAVETGRRRSWVAYAVLSAGAMYSHYTAAFPLLGQLGWAWWSRPARRRELIVANLAAAALFVPWIPGYLADQSSPTTAILSALQPFGIGDVARSLASWAIGFPYVSLHGEPGVVGMVLLAAGLGGALLALMAGFRRPAASVVRRAELAAPRSAVLLVAILAISAPLGEAVYSLLGTNVLGPRNLNASWPGLALLLGVLVTAVRPQRYAAGLTTLVLAGFAIGAARTLEPDLSRPDYPAVARLIGADAGPRDVVVDSAPFTPVPLTGFDLYSAPGRREFRLGLPRSDRPFTVADLPPPAQPMIRRAIAAARDSRLYLIRPLPSRFALGSGSLHPATTGLADELLAELPRGYRIERRVRFPALAPLEVDVVSGPRAPGP